MIAENGVRRPTDVRGRASRAGPTGGAPYRPTRSGQVQAEQRGRQRAEYVRKLGPPPATTWRNLSDLDQIVTAQLAAGRAESAAVLLEQAYPPEQAPWDIVDRIATLRLHLGEPARARELWQKATTVPQPAIRDARIGTTYLVEGDFDAARRHYRQALEAKPDSVRGALLPGRPRAGRRRRRRRRTNWRARPSAQRPDETSRSAARLIAAGVARFARRRPRRASSAEPRASPQRLAGSITAETRDLARAALRGRLSSRRAAT